MIITISLQKGGTGKTTTAAALAQAAAIRGERVLAIDLDPQGNLSFTLGATMDTGDNSYRLLQGAAPADLAQQTTQGIEVIPACPDLSTISSSKGSARRLEKAIRPVKSKYDLIIIDTPAPAGELQYNALQASTGLIIPLQADTYNIQSLYQTTDTARQIQGSNPDLSILGIVLTVYEGRSNFDKQVKQTIIDQAAALGVPYLGAIRKGIAVKEAAGVQESLFEYAPKSNPATDYMAIYEKIRERG